MSEDRFGALFPRVHVSETRVSGPRPPPRNKMALFEQFTVPSHRFLRSERASDKELSDLRESTSFSSGLNNKLSSKNKKLQNAQQTFSDASCSKGKHKASGELITKDKLYSSSVTSECTGTVFYHGSNRDLLFGVNSLRKKRCHNSPSDSAVVNCDETSKKRNTGSTEAPLSIVSKNAMAASSNSQRKEVTSNATTKSSFADQVQEVNSVRKPHKSCDNHVEENEAFTSHAASNDCSLDRSPENEACGPKHIMTTTEIDSEGLKPVMEFEVMNLKRTVVHQTQPECSCNGEKSTEITTQVAVNQEHLSKQIVPKNVIAAIGQREFWEARRTIIQQQRTLSLQVFELHRAIKVQNMIADMPEILLGESDKETEILDEQTSSPFLERKIDQRQKHKVSKQLSENSKNVYNGRNEPPQLSTQTSKFNAWSCEENKLHKWTYPFMPVIKNQASSQLQNPLPTAYVYNTMALHSALPYPISGWQSKHTAHSAGGTQSLASYDISNFLLTSFPCARVDEPSCSYKATGKKIADREVSNFKKPESTLACTNDSKSALVPKIIRAVPRSAAVAAQSAAEILKTLQEESQR